MTISFVLLFKRLVASLPNYSPTLVLQLEPPLPPTVVMILHCRSVIKLLYMEPFTPCGGSNWAVWSVLLAAGYVILLCWLSSGATTIFHLWKAYNCAIER
jgi:hypothetical protein